MRRKKQREHRRLDVDGRVELVRGPNPDGPLTDEPRWIGVRMTLIVAGKEVYGIAKGDSANALQMAQTLIEWAAWADPAAQLES